jgi:hypothetical protein
MVYACSPILFLWLTTADLGWPGVLRLTSQLDILVLGVSYGKIFLQYLFIEIGVNVLPTRNFGYKKRDLSGLNSGKESPKTTFDCDSKGCRIIPEQM